MVSEPKIQHREPRLADYAGRLGAEERHGVALHLHMGSLRAEHRQPFHNRLCHEALRPFVEQHKSPLYQTISGDLIVILFAIDDEGLNALLAGLRLLYAADPLTESARPSDSGRFSKIYLFADALDEFKALTRRLMKPWTAAQNDDLSRATLTGARLTDADLTGANTDQADFSGADTTGARLQSREDTEIREPV